MISVLIADDHPSHRAGIVMKLNQERDMRVVGEVGTGPELFARLAKMETPNIVLLDIQMPQFNVMESVPRLRSAYPAMKILIVTGYADRADVCELIEMGVEGYLLKEEHLTIYPVAIRDIVAGKHFFSESVTDIWLAERSRKPVRLSRREAEVLQLVADGATSGEIGRQLSISAKTVDTHIERIYHKLNMSNRPGMVARGYELGLIKRKDKEDEDDGR